MNKKHRQIYRNIIAIILLVIITLPVVLQPGHYLLIEHDHYHHQDRNSVEEESKHINCAIDDFQLSKVTIHSILIDSQVTCLNITLKSPHKQINSKCELNIPFSLRAPPDYC